MNLFKKCLAGLTVALLATSAVAEHFDDGLSARFAKSLKGKTVAFVPISMGMDLVQGWSAGMQRQAKEYGYKIVVRDANWSVEAGAQAINQLIAEKPDILVIHNMDMQAYNRLVKKANDANISVLAINMKAVTNGDAYVGVDWYQLAAMQAEIMGKICGAPGKSGKVAILQGTPTTIASQVGVSAIEDTFKNSKTIKIVAKQSADWDGTKARAVTATMLKQHEDLCGIIGLWDNQDIGAAAAIREAGKSGKVFLISSGGGNQKSACDNIANGSFGAYVSYDVPGQVRDLNNAIKILLQAKPAPAGSKPFALYTPLKVLSKETLRPDSCWTVDEITKLGGYGG